MRLRITPEETVEIERRIVQLIEATPCTTVQLSRHLHIDAKAVQRRLVGLRDAGVIHPIANPNHDGNRVRQLWVPGEGPARQAAAGETPRRILAKAGTPHHQRDPLVAALFGPAPNAPRCTHCRAGEGMAHGPDCAVARYVS